MKKRRIYALLLLLCLCLSYNPPQVSAAVGEEVFFCGFEDDGYESWYAYGGWGGEHCSIVTDTSVTQRGKVARLTYNSDTGSVYITKQLPVTGGLTYTLTGYIEADVESGNGFNLGVVYGIGSANANPVGGTQTETYYTTNNVYVKVEVEFTVPAEADNLMIRPRLYGAGTVHIDDIMLTETAGPAPFTITTSHVFHYTDQTAGSASVTLHSYYGANTPEASSRAVFTISDGAAVIKEETVSFSNHVAEFQYAVQDCLRETKKRYDFTIRVLMPDGSVAKEYSQGLYLYERPARLNAAGEYILNGKVFHPVIAYHVNVPDENTADADNAFLKAKKAGINVVQVGIGYSRWGENGSALRQNLDHVLAQLEKYDLYGIFCLYSSHSVPGGGTTLCTAAGCKDEIANTRAMAENLAEEERVFAWAVMDEPLGHGSVDASRYNELEQAYHEIRQRDSMHPVYIVDFTPSYFASDLKYCDVFAPDIYSTTQTGVLDATAIATRLAKKAGNKPVYTIVKAYKSTSNLTFTTPDILRHTVYQAVMAGADGVGFYSFSDCIPATVSETGQNVSIYETELWPMMVQFKEELPILFETAVRKGYTEEKAADHILRKYGDRSIILPFCPDSVRVPIGAEHGAEILYGGEDRLLPGYSVQVEAFIPVFLEYGHAWTAWKGEEKVKELSEGEYVLQFSGGEADLYVAVYAPNRELYHMFMAKNTTALVVTIPGSQFSVSAFAFVPGTLRPVVKKTSL